MVFLSEAGIEQALIDLFKKLGYQYLHGDVIAPEGSHAERMSYDQVILSDRLTAAVAQINPHIPVDAQRDAISQVMQRMLPNLLEENRRMHRLLTEGVDVEFYAEDGMLTADKVMLIDFTNPDTNDWLVVNQVVVIGHAAGSPTRRIPDVVVFVNGLPLAVIELKAPGSVDATVRSAHNQIQTYKQQIAELFRTNALVVVSDGLQARIGSLSADFERYMPWRTTDGQTVALPNSEELSVLTKGVFEKHRFLELLADFIVFGDTGSGLAKIIAGYHQFHAVKHAVASTIRASAKDPHNDPVVSTHAGPQLQKMGDRKAGVIWHTQGSGKSLLMLFYAGQLVKHPKMQNPTLVVVTDRNDLDEQLFGTFSAYRDLIRQTPIKAENRAHLQEKLDRASGGVIFTTIQKFAPDAGTNVYPTLTDRYNVVVIADEAHRSQYGLRARVDATTGELSYGFAKYLREALPNASFIGFTGTPIETADVNTPAMFGEYIDIYDITRAVEDGATVPIYYESRLARVELDDAARQTLDHEIDALVDDESIEGQELTKRKWARIEAIVGSEQRIQRVAEDMVQHFEARIVPMDGKAMVVCMSRRICVALYNAIVAVRPSWHSDDDTSGTIKIVMTGAATEPQEWQPHIGTKGRRDLLAKRLRAPNDDLKIVIVCDMWLTGFDASSLHTMYIDKPMKGHGLMQAIARVNRVFRDKQGGLIVDYIGIAQNLKLALSQYSAPDQNNTGIDTDVAIKQLQERYEVVKTMYHGFDYQTDLDSSPIQRLGMLGRAINWILDMQQRDAITAKESEERKGSSAAQIRDAHKKARRRYHDAVLALSKAFSLASASDDARLIRDEVGFFQAVRIALIKSEDGSGSRSADRDLAIQQIVSRAVISTDIVDILRASGLQSPDISILSDAFLEEVQQLSQKNLALDALHKLLSDSIRSRGNTNIVQGKAFSKRLEDAIARYHANAITTAEIMQELINLAHEIRAARQRGEEQGLSDAEVAFYDALAENQSAVDMMGEAQLLVIAHELLTNLRNSVAVDWTHRESARARMRVLVKRILRRYGYPPDLQDTAVQTVLQQAEVLSAQWARNPAAQS